MIEYLSNFFIGISLFLFGMNSLTYGLKKINKYKFTKIIKKTNSKIYGLVLGTFATALCQSSSFITVLLVGLVDSNIMTINNSIGLIMGSNIGTCITSWILSFSDQRLPFFTIFSLNNLLGIIALISICYLFKKQFNKAQTIFGFVILVLGMTLMTQSLSPLASLPSFQNILFLLSNPILGLFLGIIITSIFQSSSLIIGILESISITSYLPFLSGFTVILGSNIGSCSTALISSINTSQNSKLVAIFHLIFNIIGVIVFLIIFYLLNYFFNFKFVYQNLSPWHIALIHTFFNIGSTIILLPFTNLLLKISNLLIKK